jgi:hypothetical protein
VNFLQSFLTALETGALAAANVVLQQVVISTVIVEAAKLLVDLIGFEAAFLVAVVLSAFSFTADRGLLGSQVKGAPWAEELLRVSTGLSRAIEIKTASAFRKYEKDLAEFLLLQEEKTEELEAAQALLEFESLIDPFEFVGMAPFSIYGETPQEYFNRTVHSGNIGVEALNAISGYVDTALTLPRTNETVGDSFYAAV